MLKLRSLLLSSQYVREPLCIKYYIIRSKYSRYSTHALKVLMYYLHLYCTPIKVPLGSITILENTPLALTFKDHWSRGLHGLANA